MERFITIVKHNYSWNQIRKIRNGLKRLDDIYFHPKCNDKTKRIIDFYKRNQSPIS